MDSEFKLSKLFEQIPGAALREYHGIHIIGPICTLVNEVLHLQIVQPLVAQVHEVLFQTDNRLSCQSAYDAREARNPQKENPNSSHHSD